MTERYTVSMYPPPADTLAEARDAGLAVIAPVVARDESECLVPVAPDAPDAMTASEAAEYMAAHPELYGSVE